MTYVPNSWIKVDGNTDQEISNDSSVDTREVILSTNIVEDNVHH